MRSPSVSPPGRNALAKQLARLAKDVGSIWIDARSLSAYVDDPRLKAGVLTLCGLAQDLVDVEVGVKLGSVPVASDRAEYPLFNLVELDDGDGRGGAGDGRRVDDPPIADGADRGLHILGDAPAMVPGGGDAGVGDRRVDESREIDAPGADAVAGHGEGGSEADGSPDTVRTVLAPAPAQKNREADCGLRVFKVDAPGLEPRFVRARKIIDVDQFLRAILPESKLDGVTVSPVDDPPANRLAARVAYEDIDYTRLKEAIFMPRKGTKSESRGSRERIAQLEDWRARQAKNPVPDDIPEWGRWSEFWVYLDVPGMLGKIPVNVISDGGREESGWHLEFRGPISSSGFYSYFLSNEVERARKVGIVQFALETASRLNAELRGDGGKLRRSKSNSRNPKKPKASSMSSETRAAVVETLRELGIHDCTARPGDSEHKTEPIGPPPETIRPEPSWEVGSRWQIEVKFGPTGFAVFDFHVMSDLDSGAHYRQVEVGRPSSLGFDPSVRVEIAHPKKLAGPREWSIELAERMMKDQLAANEQAVRRAEAESKRREDEPRWGRPQKFEVSIEIRIGTLAIIKAELRPEDADKGVWITWPMSMREAEYHERSDAEASVSPRALVESVAHARYKVAPSGPPGFQWGKPDRFIHQTAVDGKAATFRVRVEPNEREGAWIVTIAPPEWLDESPHIFDVDEHTADSCVVDDFVSDQIEAIVKAWREERGRPKKLVDMTEEELTEAVEAAKAKLDVADSNRPPAEKPLEPFPSTWEDLPVTELGDAPGKPKLTSRQANALSIKGIRTLGELQARLWEIPDLDGFRPQDYSRLRNMFDRWLEWHVRAKLDDGSAIDEELSHALLDRPESQARWRDLLRKGCDDKRLKQAIADEFASGIGSSYGKIGRVDHQAKGGKTPEFRWGAAHLRIAPLKGQALVDRVRRLLSIPFPVEAEPGRTPLPGQTSFIDLIPETAS